MKFWKTIGTVLDNIWAPAGALVFDPDGERGKNDNYLPEKRHVGFWFFVAVIALVGSWIFKWSDKYADVAGVAFMVCRFALVERRVADLTMSLKTLESSLQRPSVSSPTAPRTP